MTTKNNIFFGIAINDCEEVIARDVAARLFISPRITATHANVMVGMFLSGRMTYKKIVEYTDKHIKELMSNLICDSDIARSMKDKFEDWKMVFNTTPTKEDYDYLYETFKIRACETPLFNSLAK